ncbi:MAG: porin [Aliivibrio sp.]|nr:porin [Aliivibrio sp.]
MKKTILAALIASTATTAIAGDIYSNETTKVSFGGEVDAYLSTMDTPSQQQDADVNVWAKVQMDAEQKINDSLTGFASFEIQSGSWYDGTNPNATFDDVLVGVKTDVWGVAVGEVGDLAESADAIQKDDITNEGMYMGSAGGNHRESDGKGAVAKVKVGPMVFVADVNTVTDSEIGNTYGVSADLQHEMFSVGAAYISGEATAQDDYELYGVSVSAEINGLYVAATYAEFEGSKDFAFYTTDTVADGNTIGLAASYQLNETRIYTTYAIASIDNTDAKEYGDTTNWVIGADYAVASNISTFVEYQQAEADWEADDASTVVAGVYYSF